MFPLIKLCLDSGISKRDFVKQHGIEEASFYYWHRKYQESLAKTEEQFIPLTIPDIAKQPEQTIPIPIPNKTEIEISYPNGVKLKLNQAMDLSVIRSLIGLI